MEHKWEWTMLERFEQELIDEEKSEATREKYIRDVKNLFRYTENDNVIDKERAMKYKIYLQEHYAVTSANSMIASINRFFKFVGWYDCVVKALRVQKEAFRSYEKELTREEYYRLVETARESGNERLHLMIQTICSTGIRISELKYITAEAIHSGKARVSLKGKTRTVLLPSQLRRKLKKYSRERKILEGSIFITRNGNPIDRSNVVHEMKRLCEAAGVDQRKVFPHNLRHLFACTYYRMEKDLSHLADLLGHSSVNTTRIYTQLSGEEQIRQIELLGLIL